MPQTIDLGKRYRDRITGFTGIATARHEYLNGCVRISLMPTVLADGKPIDGQSFDSQDMVLVDDGVAVVARPTGGPGDVPAPRAVPSVR